MTDEDRTLEIAILVCPGYMPVDVIGFHTALGVLPQVNVHLVGKNLDEISGFPDFPTRATITFEDCPADLDVLYAGAVPADVLEDAETLGLPRRPGQPREVGRGRLRRQPAHGGGRATPRLPGHHQLPRLRPAALLRSGACAHQQRRRRPQPHHRRPGHR